MIIPNKFNGHDLDGRRLYRKGLFSGIGKAFRGVGKAVGKAVGSVVGSLTGADAAKEQAKAMREANAIAQQQAQTAQQQINAANAKEPDVDTIKSGNTGTSATMLTGAAGASVDDANKKKKTLLGGA